MSAPGLDKAIAAVCDGVPVQRCTVRTGAGTCSHMPPSGCVDEITAEYNDMVLRDDA